MQRKSKQNKERHLKKMPLENIVGRLVTFAERKLSITRRTFSLYMFIQLNSYYLLHKSTPFVFKEQTFSQIV
jgi:hypothetical protein